MAVTQLVMLVVLASVITSYFIAKKCGLSAPYWVAISSLVGPLAIPAMLIAARRNSASQNT